MRRAVDAGSTFPRPVELVPMPPESHDRNAGQRLAFGSFGRDGQLGVPESARRQLNRWGGHDRLPWGVGKTQRHDGTRKRRQEGHESVEKARALHSGNHTPAEDLHRSLKYTAP